MLGKHHTIEFGLGIALLTTIFSFAVLPAAAQAQARDMGYHLVISQQSAATSYGADCLFTAILTFPLADPPIDLFQFHFIVDSQSFELNNGPVTFRGQSNGQTTGQVTFELNSSFFDTETIGQHSISATYFVASTQTTIQSNTSIHTVTKADIGDIECYPSDLPRPGDTVSIRVQIGNTAIDPRSATYNISVTGNGP